MLIAAAARARHAYALHSHLSIFLVSYERPSASPRRPSPFEPRVVAAATPGGSPCLLLMGRGLHATPRWRRQRALGAPLSAADALRRVRAVLLRCVFLRRGRLARRKLRKRHPWRKSLRHAGACCWRQGLRCCCRRLAHARMTSTSTRSRWGTVRAAAGLQNGRLGCL